MIREIPNLAFFSRMYWNQMGKEVFISIDRAFEKLLDDAAKLPDRGVSFRRNLLKELMLINGSDRYSQWLREARQDSKAIDSIGGRFILPKHVPVLVDILTRYSDDLDS